MIATEVLPSDEPPPPLLSARGRLLLVLGRGPAGDGVFAHIEPLLWMHLELFV